MEETDRKEPIGPNKHYQIKQNKQKRTYIDENKSRNYSIDKDINCYSVCLFNGFRFYKGSTQLKVIFITKDMLPLKMQSECNL